MDKARELFSAVNRKAEIAERQRMNAKKDQAALVEEAARWLERMAQDARREVAQRDPDDFAEWWSMQVANNILGNLELPWIVRAGKRWQAAAAPAAA